MTTQIQAAPLTAARTIGDSALWHLGPRMALGLLLGVSLVLRLGWAAGMELCNDEAYHYLFTVHPDWSYFDHPPMTMWFEWLGIHLCGGWVHPLSLRLGFVLLTASSTWLVAMLTARRLGAWAGFYAALLLNLTLYYAGAGNFALPDPPLLFFSLLTIVALTRALFDEPERTLPWLWVGVAFAMTLLSKYHAVFLPIGVFTYIVLTPGQRHLLTRPGPYLALAIGSLGFTPVLIWNAQHDWLSFAFQSSRAVGVDLRLDGLLTTLIGPIVYLFPWNWLLIVSLLFQRLRRFGTVVGLERLLVCLAMPPIVLFLAVSCVQLPMPHWSLIGFVFLLPLAGAKWSEWADADVSRTRRWIAPMTLIVLTLAGLVLLQDRFGVVTFPDDRDPLIEISGWESVGQQLKERGIMEEPRTFLFTTQWYDSGQLAFAVRSEIPVLCYNQGNAHGFAQWSDPEDWLDWNGVLVTPSDDANEVNRLRPYFTDVEFVADLPMTRGGKPFRRVRVWRFRNQQKPFPFGYGARGAKT
jgi:hypothetical protein